MPFFRAVFAIIWFFVGRPLFALCIAAEDFWNWNFSNVEEFWTGPFFAYSTNSRVENGLWWEDVHQYDTFWDLFLSSEKVFKERKY